MSSATFHVLAGADDGSTYMEAYITGSQDLDAVGYYSGYGSIVEAWRRFDNVTIPKSATITECYLRVYAGGYGNGTDTHLGVYFNNADDAENPADYSEFSGKALTGKIDWDVSSAWTIGTWHNSPELKTILQTVVNRSGWASGNALMVIIKDDGSGTGEDNNIQIQSYDYGPGTYEAELHVTWEAAGAAAGSTALELGLTGNLTARKPIAATSSLVAGLSAWINRRTPIVSPGIGLELSAEGPLGIVGKVDLAGTCGMGADLTGALTKGPLYGAIALELTCPGTLSKRALFGSLGPAITMGGPLGNKKYLNGHAWLDITIQPATLLDRQTPTPTSTYLTVTGKPLCGYRGNGLTETETEIPVSTVAAYLVKDAGSIMLSEAEPTGTGLAGLIAPGDVEVEAEAAGDGLAGFLSTDATETTLELSDSINSKGYSPDSTVSVTLTGPRNALYSYSSTVSLEVEAEPIGKPIATGIALGVLETEVEVLSRVLSGSIHYNAVEIELEINEGTAEDLYTMAFILTGTTLNPSVYTGYNFSSFCMVDGKAYGTNDTGIYLLEGDNDAGDTIHTGVRISKSAYGSNRRKRPRMLRLGPEATAAKAYVITEQKEKEYPANQETGVVMSDRHHYGKLVEYQIKDFDELKEVEVLISELAR